eukprot:1181361-Prorocentrum_minimum.AAC.1
MRGGCAVRTSSLVGPLSDAWWVWSAHLFTGEEHVAGDVHPMEHHLLHGTGTWWVTRNTALRKRRLERETETAIAATDFRVSGLAG